MKRLGVILFAVLLILSMAFPITADRNKPEFHSAYGDLHVRLLGLASQHGAYVKLAGHSYTDYCWAEQAKLVGKDVTKNECVYSWVEYKLLKENSEAVEKKLACTYPLDESRRVQFDKAVCDYVAAGFETENQ
jgi:hypothetical protein